MGGLMNTNSIHFLSRLIGLMISAEGVTEMCGAFSLTTRIALHERLSQSDSLAYPARLAITNTLIISDYNPPY